MIILLPEMEVAKGLGDIIIEKGVAQQNYIIQIT